MTDWFFDGWSGIGETLVVGTIGYAALILMLRISGNRSLAKMSAFDLVVTVAMGSIFASLLVSSSVGLARGLCALALLLVLQFAIAKLSLRSERFRNFVTCKPALLLERGVFNETAMAIQRVNRDEILAALRAVGATDPTRVAAVVFEADGTFGVLTEPGPSGSVPTLEGVARA